MALTRLPSFTLLSTDSYTFGNANVSGNVSAGNLKTDHLLYSNGSPYVFTTNAAGTNTQIQFNDANSFAGSANLTFDKTTNTLTVTNIISNGAGLTSLTGANVTGAVSYATTANSVAVANVVGIGNIATINKDGNASNILYGNGVFASAPVTYANSNVATFLASFGSNTITTTGNITAGNANLGNLVTANFFSGNGHYLTDILGTQISGEVAFANKANSVAGANVTGQVSNALVSGTVYTAAQPNITSVGTLTSVTTSGDGSIGGNLSVTGNLTVSGTVTTVNSTTVNINDINIVLANNATTAAQADGAGITINGASATILYSNTSNAFVFSHLISANGSLLSNITGANVTGAVSYATTANSVAGANVSGAVSYATTANSVAGANVTGAVSYATTANSVAVANVSGIGNIATINKDGNASNILYGNGTFAAAPVTYGNSNVATYLASFGSNTITTTGNVTVGNIIGNGQALTGLPGANVTGAVSYATTANSVAVANVSGIGNIAVINLDGNASNILYGNGSFAAAPVGGGSNSDVALNTAYVSRTYTGDGSTKNYTITANLTATSVIATLSGVVQTPTTDYTVSGTTLSFVTAPPNGVSIQIREMGIPLASGSNAQILFNDNGVIGGTANLTFNKTTGMLSAAKLTATSANLGPVANLRISGGNVGDILASLGNGQMAWANVAANGNVIVNGSVGGGGASVTVSDTAPTSPASGDLWMDSEAGELNVYLGSGWVSVSEAPPQLTSTVNYFTGDSVTTQYTLSATPPAIEYTLVAVGGLLQPRSTYSLSANVITFSSAIPTNSPIEVTILGGSASPIGVATTVTASAQPNVTSTGTLTGLNVNGDVAVTGNLTINNTKPATTGKAIAMAIVFGF